MTRKYTMHDKQSSYRDGVNATFPAMATFTQELRQFLKRTNMRQAEFARRVGVNRQLVGNWLNGSTPDGENYARAIRVMYPDRGELNDALWLECTVAVEEELAKRGLSLPPATKLRLAQSFYKHFQRSGIAADAAFIGDVIDAWDNDDPNDKNKRG